MEIGSGVEVKPGGGSAIVTHSDGGRMEVYFAGGASREAKEAAGKLPVLLKAHVHCEHTLTWGQIRTSEVRSAVHRRCT